MNHLGASADVGGQDRLACAVRFLILAKRFYTNKDLLRDRFGRNFHLPVQLGDRGHRGLVLAFSYRGRDPVRFSEHNVDFLDVSLGGLRLSSLTHAYRLAREFEPDVVVGSSDVHFGWAANALARRLGTAAIYDLYDNYEAFASARIPGVLAMHRRTLRSVDLVVAVSPALAEHVQPLTSRVTVVGNGVDTSLFFRRPGDLRKELGLGPTAIVVGYVGGISEGRGLETVIEGIRAARDDGLDAHLVLAGPNTSRLGLSEAWIYVLAPMPQADVPAVISTFDVAVWPYLGDAWGRFVHPNKLAEYLACGVPVVATDLPEFRRIAPFRSVSWYRPGDPEDFCRTLLARIESRVPIVLPDELRWENQGSILERALLDALGPPTDQDGGGVPPISAW